jgi:sulfur carrier protein
MQILLNGESFDVRDGTTLAGLTGMLDLGDRRYAIEVNGELVPRGDHPGHVLQPSDRVEIVQAIGGG